MAKKGCLGKLLKTILIAVGACTVLYFAADIFLGDNTDYISDAEIQSENGDISFDDMMDDFYNYYGYYPDDDSDDSYYLADYYEDPDYDNYSNDDYYYDEPDESLQYDSDYIRSIYDSEYYPDDDSNYDSNNIKNIYDSEYYRDDDSDSDYYYDDDNEETTSDSSNDYDEEIPVTPEKETTKKDTTKDKTDKTNDTTTKDKDSGGKVIKTPKLPTGQVASTTVKTPKVPTKTWSSDAPAKFVECAKSYLGTPYVLGGNSHSGIDCSGLVYNAAQEAGIGTVPRTAKALQGIASKIDKSELSEGDLVFFSSGSTISHVAIYLGNNEIIHAVSDGSNTGVITSKLSQDYWKKHYYSSGRIINTSK